jgi:hypothetical protein
VTVAKQTIRILVALLCLVFAYVLLIPPVGRPAAIRPRNAVWVDRHWLRGTMTAADMQREIHRMAVLQIKTLFVHAGPFGPDGTVPAYDPDRITMIQAAADSVDKEVRVLAWLGGLNAAGGGDFELMSESVRSAASRITQRFVAEGFDGVQLNIEPTRSGDAGFLRLLADVRTALPEGAFVSVATNLWGPRWLPNRMLFSDAYLRQVAALVDQIAVMNYDSYAVTVPLYRRIAGAQTRAALRAAQDGGVSVLIGVPAYPSEGGFRHRGSVESVRNALAGIDAGLAKMPVDLRGHFEGVAIYAGWTATEDDWQAVGQWHRP